MRLWAVLMIGAVLGAPALAREIDPAERREVPFDANIPVCNDATILAEITSDFSRRESRFWNSSLQIVAYDRVRQVAWRPWGLDTIPRRFCSGIVTTSDGHRRQIHFSVREELGFIGTFWDTDWCVEGLDRHYAYAPRCKQAQP
ncbi:MAG TPA: hypothetical protein VIL09_19720 [Microvirga sp.]